MENGQNALWDVLAKSFEPKPKLNVWQWAEKNIVLSSRVTPHPGPYRTNWCRYVREPQETFTDPSVSTIVLCWSTRSSKTESMMNCIRYSIAHDPQSILIVMPTHTLARSWSETRFQPSIDDSPILRAEKPKNSDKFKLDEMHFRRCSCWVIGSNSPANLKGRGVTILLGDEIDTWPQRTEKETGALEQVLERTKDRWNKKHLLTSTPTVTSGQIWKEFLLGDQRYYWVPCPHCNEFQTLKMKQIKWPEDAKKENEVWDLVRVKSETWYECEHCKNIIRDEHKPMMIRSGEWRPMVCTSEPGRRSYHLNSIYPEWITFGEISVMFLQSKGSQESLQRFVNSWLAEPFLMYGDQKEFEELVEKSKVENASSQMPAGSKNLITVDVQSTHLYFVVRCHGENKESALVDYGMLPGFDELLIVAKKHNCIFGFIDSAFRPQIILEWCKKNPGWIPMLGSSALFTPMRWSDIPIDGGMFKGQFVKTLRIRPNDWKDILHDRIKGKGAKWIIPAIVGNDYKKQMAGEHRVEKKIARGKISEWIKHGENHYWDCECYQIAAYEAIRPLIFAKSDGFSPPPLPPAARQDITSYNQAGGDLWNGEQIKW